MEIKSDETSIVEQWEFVNNKMISNEQGKRIEWLRKNYLTKIATDESGWLVIYQDPNDKRYWELSYPNGEMQGGGPKLLKVIPKEEAMSKYIF
jgi:hypothetical protein